MANPDIARCACPICSGDSALRETTKKKSYIVCENCGVQIFARAPESDRILRERAGVASKPAATIPTPAKPAPEKAAPVTVRRHTSEGETITETQQVQQPGEAGEETPLLDFLLNLGGGKK